MRSKQIIGVLIALFLGLTNVRADDTWMIWGGANGVYNSDKPIGNVTFNAKGTTLVLLEGDVTITGTITVDNSTTLRILNLTGQEFTIKNGKTGNRKTPLFKVIGGAKLAFNYTDYGFVLRKSDNTIYKTVESDGDWSNMTAGNTKYSPINLDGGAVWATNTEGEEYYEQAVEGGTKRVLSASNDVRFVGQASMIESIGALEFFKVNIRNFYGQDYFGKSSNDRSGVFGIAPRAVLNELSEAAISSQPVGSYKVTFNYRYTHLKCCLIEKCKSRTGVFLSIDRAASTLQDAKDAAGNPTGWKYQYQIQPESTYAGSGILVEDCTIRDCVVFGDISGWGGLIRCKGGSSHHLTLRNTTFDNNFSHGDGAGLWWNAGGHSDTKCIIDGCTFSNNRAMRNAGALRLEAIFEFTGNKTVVTGNECFGLQRDSTDVDQKYVPSVTGDKGNGAGIHIFGYASEGYSVGGTLNFDLSEVLEVTDNYAAGQGGGIAFDFTQGTKLSAGTVVTADFDGPTVTGNRAGMDGGGIYFNNTTPADRNYTFNIHLNAGTITGNEACRGGGILTSNVDVSFNEAKSNLVTIDDNHATAGSGGGVYISGGSLSLDQVNVTNNTSVYDDIAEGGIFGGGGVYVEDGSFGIQSGAISNNSSGMYGGGVFVYNSTATANDVQLSGGEIKQNNALYGGGLAAYGNLDLTIQDIDIQNNTALNGGGILMEGIEDGPAKLNYKSGIIRYNQAKAHDGQTLETAYDLDYTTLSGLGGGFYVGQHSQLSFADEDATLYADADFGIYSNVADNGADDLFGYNSDVKITLPDVQNMNLDGFEGGSILNLFWGEDYITNDTNYDKGLKLKGDAWDSDPTNQRFRDVFKSQEGDYYTVEFADGETSKVYENKYLSLTLIWHEDYMLLVKKGMQSGENAIFNIYKVDGSGNQELYVSVMLTDADDDGTGTRSKRITLKNAGTYKVVELPWAWAYDVDNQQQQKVVGQNSSEEERTFTFVNTPKDSAPPHDESLKVNQM